VGLWVCGIVGMCREGVHAPFVWARLSPFSLPLSFPCTDDARTAGLIFLFLVSVIFSSRSELCKVSDFIASGNK